MSDINDFGFTAVDQDELVSKTGETAAVNEEVAKQLKEVAKSSASSVSSAQVDGLESKIDLMSRNLSSALLALDDHKENLSLMDSKQELEYQDKIIEMKKLILPLLQNLMKNDEKEYIYWPNRKPIIQQQIDRIEKITK
ncbi:MAG: hypothetical protein CBE07_003275 [Pelagibacteraceae bacterium TMED247]|nr:MAG: hypothetical protein CBE07_003275 [Pelagibacteraceae bacterium TMED247]|tara:strand:+ start:2904 stop:3320 length:417 start_codon:yes stop_codon:yes gene_type:complete